MWTMSDDIDAEIAARDVIVGTTKLGPFTINVRQGDHDMAAKLDMEPERHAVARQPIGHGWEAFDLAEGSWTPSQQ